MDFDAEKMEKIWRSPFFIGMLGAIVSLKFAPGNSWPERAFNVVCGGMIAGFGAPAACEWFAFASVAMKFAVAFFTGLFGMNLVSSLWASAKELRLSDLLPWIRRKE